MAQKISRKKLLKEPDEFITFSGKMIQWFKTYNIYATASVGVLLVLIVAVAGFQAYTRHSEKIASERLTESLNRYQIAMKDKDPIKAYQTVEKSFNEILNDYSGATMGQIAGIEFANICFRAGEFDNAIALYTTALKQFKDTPFINDIILNGLGYACEGKKDLEGAAKYFETLLSETESMQKDLYLFSLASVYEKMGNKEKSKTLFLRIVAEYPSSLFVEVAKDQTVN